MGIFDFVSCDYENEYSIAMGGKPKCYLDRSLSAINFVIFWVLFYQIYFVYRLTYQVPVIQLRCRKKQYKERDLRQDILLVSAITSFYTTLHYLTWPEYRAKLFGIIVILQFHIAVLIMYYYLSQASEQVFPKHQELKFKFAFGSLYFLFLIILFWSMISIIVMLDANQLNSQQLCISSNYMVIRWLLLIFPIIFLIITAYVQVRIEEDFQRKIEKVNFEQIIFKDRFASSISAQQNSLNFGK